MNQQNTKLLRIRNNPLLLDRMKLMEMYLLTKLNTSEVDKWDTLSWLAMNTWKQEMPSMSVTAIQESGKLTGSHHYLEEFLSEAVYLNLVKYDDDRKYRRYRINLDEQLDEDDINFQTLLRMLWAQEFNHDINERFTRQKWNCFGDNYPAKFGVRNELMFFTLSHESWRSITDVNGVVGEEGILFRDGIEDFLRDGIGGWRLKERKRLLHLNEIYKSRHNIYYTILTGHAPLELFDPALTEEKYIERMKNDIYVNEHF